MWFKNIRVYQVAEPLQLEPTALESALSAFKFSPCTGQEAVRSGFTTPLHPLVGQYHYQLDQLWFFAIKRQEKVLPAAVIQEELQPKIDALEQERGKPLGRKEKQALKEELVQTLLPRAFSRSSVTQAFYDAKRQRLIVNTSSASKAEEVLSFLRKALGSLPALPWLDQNRFSQALQYWLSGEQLPAGMLLGGEAELKAPDDEGAKVKFSNHLLTADEVQSHLEDKLVTRLELANGERSTFIVAEDTGIKKIRFEELLTGQNDELGWDEVLPRLEADLLVMHAELDEIIDKLEQAVAGE